MRKEALILILVSDPALEGTSVSLNGSREIRRDLSFVVLCGATVAPLFHQLHLIYFPFIKVYRSHERYMRAKIAMNARAFNANKYTQFWRSPTWLLRRTICTNLIFWLLKQILKALFKSLRRSFSLASHVALTTKHSCK